MPAAFDFSLFIFLRFCLLLLFMFIDAILLVLLLSDVAAADFSLPRHAYAR